MLASILIVPGTADLSQMDARLTAPLVHQNIPHLFSHVRVARNYVSHAPQRRTLLLRRICRFLEYVGRECVNHVGTGACNCP